MRVLALSSFILVLAGCATVQSNAQPWPAAEKQALVEQCQAQIWQRAEDDYLKERNQTRAQLPANFRQTMSAKVQPSLAGCVCFIDRLESEWSYEQVVSQQSAIDDKLQRIRASGACARR